MPVKKRGRKMTMVILFDRLYSQGDCNRPEKMLALGRALEDGLKVANRAAGVVRMFCLPIPNEKPRPRGR